VSGVRDLGEAGVPHICPTLADVGLLDSPRASALACIIRQGGAGPSLGRSRPSPGWSRPSPGWSRPSPGWSRPLGLHSCESLNCGLQPLRSLCRNSPRAVEVEHEPSFSARSARHNVAHGVSRGSKSRRKHPHLPIAARCGAPSLRA